MEFFINIFHPVILLNDIIFIIAGFPAFIVKWLLVFSLWLGVVSVVLGSLMLSIECGCSIHGMNRESGLRENLITKNYMLRKMILIRSNGN